MNKAVNIIIVFLMISCSFIGINLLFKGVSTLDKVNSFEKKIDSTKNNMNIEKVKENYNYIFYEYQNNEFVSFITTNENHYHETLIIDNKTGQKLNIEALIKKDQIDNFWNKVYELLNLKYPEFIVEGINSSEGNIYYEIKENEMIIYFEYFSFEVSLPETISIRINYNEVKDYLNFSYKLDNEYLNESAYDYDKNKKAIALTFDDGPNSKYTNELIDILNANKAKATFFMLGSEMQKYQSNLLYVYNNGFEIGSHTYKHINMKRVSISEIKSELNKTNEVYKTITNDNIKLVRPPYGAYNDKILSSIDYPFVMWNIDTNDWRYHDKDYIVNHILDNVTDGSIILMHDSYKTTIEAVEEVLPKLYAKGYQVVTVSDLAALKGETLNNHEVYSYFK